ncbi:hypothetical protein E0H46_30280 [Rhizobium leguminosarum bv. viciae]|nr:hypothetical protein E0H46_30280 [Rhizobium leguminosarum bv. viciae]
MRKALVGLKQYIATAMVSSYRTFDYLPASMLPPFFASGPPLSISSTTFALHRQQVLDSAEAMKDGLGEKAMQIHIQRIIGSFIGSAYGAG